jgi:hypothetical protein
MKRNIVKSLVTVAAGLLLAVPGFAAEKAKNMDHSKMQMDASGQLGQKIHESSVKGYKLAYHLIDYGDKMAGVKGMEEITHHIMIFVVGPDGKKIDKAMVGYLVTNPDGTQQKLMAMEMNGAFGANVSFKAKGPYTVKTKVLAGDKKIQDSFTYEVN